MPATSTISAATPTISLLVELPEALHESLLSFLDGCPNWDQDRAFTGAIALFLLQIQSVEQSQAD